jgi:chloride channel protein, CIC family
MAPRQVAALIVICILVGLVVSLASWGFLELVHQIQVGVYDKLPGKLGFDNGAPTWWPLPILAIAGLIVAFAIERLPGNGGHDPSKGLNAGTTFPVDLPGVLLAAIATISLGAVLGPEAPLIALGSGLAIFSLRRLRNDAPDQLVTLIAAAGSFAAVSFIFGSPLIGAVILIEAAGLEKERLAIVVPVGLLASGMGSLVSIGMGSWTGLSTADYALAPLDLPTFTRPGWGDFAWTFVLAIAIAIVCFLIVEGARKLGPIVTRRRFVLLPVAGLAVAGLAILFQQTTDHSSSEVLFSGQDSLPGLVAQAGTWSSGALALVLVFKGLAWSISLSAFRGGPTFPGLYLGAAAGILISRGVGLDLTPAVAVGMAAAVASVLRLPLSGVVIATLLTANAGTGDEPLVIVGAVIAYLVSVGLDRRFRPVAGPGAAEAAPAPAASG